MSTPTDLVRGWFRKADSDLQTARTLVASAGPYDTACFHAQQAAEKYLTYRARFTHNAGFGRRRQHRPVEVEQTRADALGSYVDCQKDLGHAVCSSRVA
jgi:hypothetical protein